jgi:predicted metal-binding protein
MTERVVFNTGVNQSEQSVVETIFKNHGFTDFKWIDPQRIVVSQWVRMKCMFGCPNYGRKAACLPQTPSVPECERFFKEYSAAVVFHLRIQFDEPEERFAWYKKMTLKLAKLEKAFSCQVMKGRSPSYSAVARSVKNARSNVHCANNRNVPGRLRRQWPLMFTRPLEI